MDHLHHRVSPSQSKPSVIPKDVDENEPNYQQTNPNLQNLKKQTTKNYMSTTISAASKAIGPKKKILAERNEGSEMSSFEANFKKISVLDNPDESLFQWSGDVEDGHVDDLSSRPYDPLTNYLSPRPQFLRYKPNRRRCHVIFRGLENGDGEIEDGLISRSGSFDSLKASNEDATSDTNGSSVISSSCSSISGERSLEQEEIADEVEGTNLETEEGDEGEIEDEEEDRVCNFKGLFKSLFLLGVLVLSTMFISSTNSSYPLCELRFGEGIEDGYCKMQNHTFSYDGGEIQKGLMEVKKRAFEIDNEERNVVDFMYQGEETQMNSIDVNEDIGVENFEERERTDELKEETFFESGETDAVEVAEGENKAKVEDFCSVVEPQIGDIEEASIWGLNEPVEDYQTPFFSEEQSGSITEEV
ncbi:hypothetical protein TorRG33x02_231320 [Trema orientale]|uniref:Transmembrane protein n=1 Tax=Trema orientale TaxID=63057 RepID=A0A2P5E6E0_TREOI|nr:hypothetical protein TorRG33x02_231320 [Trema orientale]